VDFNDSFFETFNPRYTRLSLEQLQLQINLGLKINPYTVNDEDLITRFIEMGVTGLITDFPQRVLK